MRTSIDTDPHPMDESPPCSPENSHKMQQFEQDEMALLDTAATEDEFLFDWEGPADHSFSEIDEAEAAARARRYSPWESNRGPQQGGATPPRRASPRSSPTGSPESNATNESSGGTPSRRKDKSRPWRVDVLLRKGKGVERSTSSWKQQMKERKQVFALSGVTVPEADDEPDAFPDLQTQDSIFGGLEEDDVSRGDESEKAVIGLRENRSTPTSVEDREHIPGIIDLTDFELPSTPTSPSRMAANPVFIRDWKDLKDHEDMPEPRNQEQYTQVDASTHASGSAGPEENENIRYPADDPARKSMIADLQTSMTQFALEEHALETMGQQNDVADDGEPSSRQITKDQVVPYRALGMRTAQQELDTHFESTFERQGNAAVDDDDDDEIRSVRSIASAVYPSSPKRKELTRIEANRRLLIQNLEATFPQDFDRYERYTLTSSGRAGLDPPKRIHNEYFLVHQRFQRSRLVNELYSTVSLLPTRHFHVVEAIVGTEKESEALHTAPSGGSGSLDTLSFGDVRISNSTENASTLATADEAETSTGDEIAGVEAHETSAAKEISVEVGETTREDTTMTSSEMKTSPGENTGKEAVESIAVQLATIKNDDADTAVAGSATTNSCVEAMAESQADFKSSINETRKSDEDKASHVPAPGGEGQQAVDPASMTRAGSSASPIEPTAQEKSTVGEPSTVPVSEEPGQQALDLTPSAAHVLLSIPSESTSQQEFDLGKISTAPVSEEAGQQALDSTPSTAVGSPSEPTARQETDFGEPSSSAAVSEQPVQQGLDSTSSGLSSTPVEPILHFQEEASQTKTASATSVQDSSSPHLAEASKGKKSKANKWKDRLARRKSIPKRDSEISDSSPNPPPPPSDSPAVDDNKSLTNNSGTTTPTTPGKPPKAPTSTGPNVPSLTRNSPGDHGTFPELEDTLPTSSTPKGRRKSLKWKQRLANKRSSSKGESPASAGKKVASPVITEDSKMPSIEKKEALPPEARSACGSSTKSAVEEINSPSTGSTADKPAASIPETSEAFPLQGQEPETKQLEKAVEAISQSLSEEETEPAAKLHNELRNSFMAFDALLKQRQGSDINETADDDYSEYTIEETVLQDRSGQTRTASSALKGTKSAENESQYEEITVEQSFTELTIEDTADETVNDSEKAQPATNAASTPMVQTTSNLMSSRMFTTPQIAKEPTIMVAQVDDDELTQLTFDQSYGELPSKNAAETPTSAAKETIKAAPDTLSKVGTKDTQSSTNGSAEGSCKRDSLNDSNRSGQRTSYKLNSFNDSNRSCQRTTYKRDSFNESNRSGQRSTSKRESLNDSHRSGQRSTGSKGAGSTASDRSAKRVSDILRKDIWSPDASVVQEGLENIVVEASRGSKYRGKITQFGGILGIVRAMESHADVEEVQVSGCIALDRMALDPETQVIIGEMGGIVAILDAMKAFEASEDVNQAGCGALANITRHRGTTDETEGAVPILCASMSRHSNNMMVQAKAFGAIANLCMDNKYRLQELSDAGGMLAMTMALQRPWPNKTEKHQAISNLSILLRCLAEHEEGGGNDEDVYDEYGEGEGSDPGDDISAVSGLDEASVGPRQTEETDRQDQTQDKNASESGETTKVDTPQETKPKAETASSGGAKDATTTKNQALEQGSNSTQPTEPIPKEAEDENCVIS